MKSNLFWPLVCVLLGLTVWLVMQSQPTDFLSTFIPVVIAPDALFVPLLVALFFGMLLTVFSSQSPLLRCVVYLGLIFLSVRYMIWRFTETLIFDSPLSAALTIGLIIIEVAMLVPNIISDYLMFVTPTNLVPEAKQYAKNVLSGKFIPSVDVFITTFNESEDMVERTVIGCQALDYPDKKIYVLDDGHRQSMRALCEKLGCFYFSRPDNKHYKAGNLNYGYERTNGDLIAFFDADFVPAKDFLTHTVGFFQNPDIALLQTPQHFYNADPIQGNLGIHDSMTNEQDVFFRIIQSGRDEANSLICCGTSFIARRKQIDEIGGIPTISITEDYVTSLALQMKGYRVVYLNQVLSSGDAPANISFFVNQRLRWCSGIIQLLFSKEYNIFLIKGLTPMQRYFHYVTLLNWFRPAMRMVMFLMPLSFLLFGIMPLKASVPELIYYFFPLYFLNYVVNNWIYMGKSSPFWADVYDAIQIFPITVNWITTLLNPFGKGFSVTPKPLGAQKFSFEINVAMPLLVILGLFAIGFVIQWQTWSTQNDHSTAWINIAWGIYNCMVFWVALLTCINVPKERHYIRKGFNRTGRLTIAGVNVPVMVTTLCEKNATLLLPQSMQTLPAKGTVSFSLPDAGLTDMAVDRFYLPDGHSADKQMYQIVFGSLTLPQYRTLIETVYCEPGHWDEKHIPEHRYSWNFLKSICRWYPLTHTQDKAA